MEKPIIPYVEWPKWVKVATTTSIELFTIKDPKTSKRLPILSFGVGFLALAMPFFLDYLFEHQPPDQELVNLILFFGGFLNVVVGIFHFKFIAEAVQWVSDNSNWEERFSNKASLENKLIMFAILVGICIIAYILALIFQGIFR